MNGKTSTKRSCCWKELRRVMMFGCLVVVSRRASRMESWGAVIMDGVVTFRATIWLISGSLAW
jgi:hypothetical protein